MLCKRCYGIWAIRKENNAWDKLCRPCRAWMIKQIKKHVPEVDVSYLKTLRTGNR